MQPNVITETLKTFIAFRTIAGNRAQKDACLDWISQSFLTESDVAIETGECADCPFLLIVNPSAPWLWFAHTDVVPGRDDQFTLQCSGDRLLGRGVKDMKGAALPFLLAYRDTCRSEGVPPVSILISTDEETGGKTIPTLLQKGLKTPIAFTPDTGSSPGIVTEHKGAVWLVLTSNSASYGRSAEYRQSLPPRYGSGLEDDRECHGTFRK
ncbi:MAG: Acetylornithine deacetylase [Candidatus Peregrinibacteria bacterium Greene1014_49]|nr:MAG: Acetylornithine deacetylase [Candidatus Peregrinibacteria bacterium Greene1014_49]